jgi:hypothetical protein
MGGIRLRSQSPAIILSIFLLVMLPVNIHRIGLENQVGKSPDQQYMKSVLDPMPYSYPEAFTYWTNITNGLDQYIEYRIASTTNDTWWHVDVWNATTDTYNNTAYVEKVSGEGGHEHVYGVENYTVVNFGISDTLYQWDRWFDLDSISEGSQIGPIETESGDSITLTVNSTEVLTTPAGTFTCWVANQTTAYADVNYWIDKESNITVQTSYYITMISTVLMEQLVEASWLNIPVIEDVQSEPLRFSATITWTTDDLANSQVNYGISSDDLNMTKISGELTSSHEVVLEELKAKTRYYFEILSTDAWGNTALDNNSDSMYQFTTLSADTPKITEIQATPLSNSSVKVTFNSSIAVNLTLSYSEETPLSDMIFVTDFKTHHSVDITGLKEGTEYLYQIFVSDVIGNNATTSIRSFTTLDLTAPTVLSISHDIERDTLIVNISLNEESGCELYWGLTQTSLNIADNETDYSTIQVVSVSSLPSYERIYYSITIYDASGNKRIVMNGSIPFSSIIPDYLQPVISHPDDIFLEEEQQLPNLLWVVSDQTPSSYQLYLNEELIEENDWSGDNIQLSLQDLKLKHGLYSIKLILYDDFGNNITDVVVVSIRAQEGISLLDQPQDYFMLFLGITVLIVVVTLLVRRRHT